MALCPLVGKRMTEATGVEAKTIRRLLYQRPRGLTYVGIPKAGIF